MKWMRKNSNRDLLSAQIYGWYCVWCAKCAAVKNGHRWISRREVLFPDLDSFIKLWNGFIYVFGFDFI
jgi:hypothetical protein